MTEILALNEVAVYRGGKEPALQIDSFAMKRGEMAALVGPNGAGKSTLLQAINLLQPYKGEIRLFGEKAEADKARALRRRTAMVFQETLLLEGSVFANVAMPLRFRGIAAGEIKARVEQALTVFGCAHLTERPAKGLSGGEGQRVCLARALVSEPELLLLDEPFAALDVATRSALLEELRQLAKQKNMAVLLVSHHFSDVLYFAERAVALFAGRILQDDEPENLLRRPVNEKVARLVGMDNLFSCTLETIDDRQFLRLSESLAIPYEGFAGKVPSFCCLPGDGLSLAVEDEALLEEGWFLLEGKVERVLPGIGVYCVLVRAGGLLWKARLPLAHGGATFVPGDTLCLRFRPEEMHRF